MVTSTWSATVSLGAVTVDLGTRDVTETFPLVVGEVQSVGTG